jgi:hypothetical protein
VAGEVSDEIGHVGVVAGFGIDGRVLDGHLVTALAVQGPGDDRGPARTAPSFNQLVDELHHVIGQSYRDLCTHTKMVPERDATATTQQAAGDRLDVHFAIWAALHNGKIAQDHYDQDRHAA